ncbi:hypothetical protein HGP28_00565 [Vibrio sp. SM6]|uniref:Uncharacterized protein n=1 Tax=Vibrio agarilyticus TaxID=2726741 RepID=A0A7X8YFJ8_9VIBR|nr:hypothetical protein [Vibrio agarilyticus]NLS11377.1 hypothetical protein [Vibrio agarilyticus]
MAILISPLAHAQQHDLCLSQKYNAYIDASLLWYSDLATLTTRQYPELADVSHWFLTGRQHHFELNRAAFDYFLANDPGRISSQRSVESWLQLSQTDVKQLASREDRLGQLAKQTYNDRQSKNHEQNYQLRSAFAELLTQPKQIEKALLRYNHQLEQLTKVSCNTL